MYTALVHSHSGIRYLLLLAFMSLLVHAFLRFREDSYNVSLHKHARITIYLFYLNIVLGFVLYFISPKVMIGPEAMKETLFRFFTLEHPVSILLSLAVLKFASYRAGRLHSKKSARILAYWGLLAFVLLLAAIPWAFRGLV